LQIFSGYILMFLVRAELAQARHKNKKTRQTPKADAGLFSWAATSRGSRDRRERNPSHIQPAPGLIDNMTLNHGCYRGYWNSSPAGWPLPKISHLANLLTVGPLRHCDFLIKRQRCKAFDL
jgi:hypothetical protein